MHTDVVLVRHVLSIPPTADGLDELTRPLAGGGLQQALELVTGRGLRPAATVVAPARTRPASTRATIGSSGAIKRRRESNSPSVRAATLAGIVAEERSLRTSSATWSVITP